MKTREEYIEEFAIKNKFLPIGTKVIYKSPISTENFMRIGTIKSYCYSDLKVTPFTWDYLVEDLNGKLFYGDKNSFYEIRTNCNNSRR